MNKCYWPNKSVVHSGKYCGSSQVVLQVYGPSLRRDVCTCQNKIYGTSIEIKKDG